MTLYTQAILDSERYTSVPLTYDQRMKHRLFLNLSAVGEAHIILPRGMRLDHGLHIQAENGSVLKIESAEEELSVVKAQGLDLARACYHLGNRHIPAAIGEGSVSYQRDLVIDDMMKGLGFDVTHDTRSFQPESGAYAAHSHEHRWQAR